MPESISPTDNKKMDKRLEWEASGRKLEFPRIRLCTAHAPTHSDAECWRRGGTGASCSREHAARWAVGSSLGPPAPAEG